jgi:hypothetical protein
MRNGLGIYMYKKVRISADWKDDLINGIYFIESPELFYVGDTELKCG